MVAIDDASSHNCCSPGRLQWRGIVILISVRHPSTAHVSEGCSASIEVKVAASIVRLRASLVYDRALRNSPPNGSLTAPYSTAALPDRALEFGRRPAVGFAHRAEQSWNCFSSQTISVNVRTQGARTSDPSSPVTSASGIKRTSSSCLSARSPTLLIHPLLQPPSRHFSYHNVPQGNSRWCSRWREDEPHRCRAHPVQPGQGRERHQQGLLPRPRTILRREEHGGIIAEL